MIRVCHLTSVHDAFDVRILHKEAVSLAGAGYEVYLVAKGHEDEVHHGVSIKAAFPPTYGRLKRMIMGTYRVYRSGIKLEADIYHLHDPELIPWGLLLKMQGKSVVYDAHEDLPLQLLGKDYLPRYLRAALARLMKWLQRCSLRYYTAVVAATPGIASGFTAHAPKVVTVRNLPLLREFHGLTPAKKKERQLCYIGGIFRMRGIVEVIRSLPMAGARLALAGSYSPPPLREELSQMPEWERVDEKGVLDRDGIRQLLAESNIGIVTLLPAPNFLESLPVKMFEYMAAGLPVIASRFPLWQEIIEDKDCGICVDPSQAQEIARAIQFLLDHPARAEEMGMNGRKAILSELNWENESRQLLDLYGSMVNEPEKQAKPRN